MKFGKAALVALLCLGMGVGVAVALFVLWLHAPSSHTSNAIWYLLSSGLVSLVTGGLALLLAARFLPRLGLKIAVATLLGSVAALINVIFTPLLMFKERSDFDILVITLLFFVAIAVAFASFVGTVITRQLRDLRLAAGRLAEGELGTQVAVEGRDEVADLGRTFNQMSSQLLEASRRREKLEQERKDLLAAVSHDLRTPIASIRAMVEAIQDGVVGTAGEIDRYLTLIGRETEHLRKLIEDLFELSRIESGTLEVVTSEIDLEELVAETVETFQVRAEAANILLTMRTAGQIGRVSADAVHLQRVLENLVENALQHSQAEGVVEVILSGQNGRVEIEVADTGVGIPVGEQELIFERFYRPEQSRSRTTGGAGLGLAIARGLVEAQGGKIRVHSETGKGARFVVSF